MNTILLPYTHQCFVCGAHNSHGLQLRFRFEDGEVRADFTPREHHTGYRGVVHGGIIASALDEVMFWAAAYARRQFLVSVEMSVRYLKKVASAEPYRLSGRLEGEQRRLCLAQAELRAADGTLCASATGKFFPLKPTEVPLSHEDFCHDPLTLSPAEFFPRTELHRTTPQAILNPNKRGQL
jgi:uncharacterized protein (TIGR00369 family)